MKTPEEILEKNCPVFGALFLDKKNKAQMQMRDGILNAMKDYANEVTVVALTKSQKQIDILNIELSNAEDLIDELHKEQLRRADQ
jgi:hypothetical protein